MKKWSLIVILLTGIITMHFFAPAQHVPWRSLDMDAPIGLATGFKINLIRMAPDSLCQEKLTQAVHLDQSKAAPKTVGHCGWNSANIMEFRGHVGFRSSHVTAQCPVILASYIWIADLDQIAQKRFGSRLSKIHHAGTYFCRRQRGNGSGAWSEHAFGNAWDITGFELKNGTVISIIKDWKTKPFGGSQKSKFLRDARQAACRVFRVVLSPDYNAVHHDHFHLDQGGGSSCS